VTTTACGAWYLLESGLGEASFNMALDEAILQAMPRLDRPVLRFYGWTEKAASFGYFQKYAEIERLTLLRPLVRRPTAGGLVPHDADWTYSLVFPTSHEWYSLTATESYCRVHQWIQAAFAKLDLVTELAPESRKAEPGQCFVGYEKFDLLWRGQKIAGAAQRRTKDGLLIQGSVQPRFQLRPSPPTAPFSHSGAAREGAVGGEGHLLLARAAWQTAMCETVPLDGEVCWIEFGRDRLLDQRLLELRQRKYDLASYHQKR